MENRLFLLVSPEELVPSGLTANILDGVDVTPENEYSGKITLTQLNAYSGELKAEALTNFKTIKIEKDGSETFTNVAKLLIELQQGSGVEDAIEEAIIVIESKQGDAELRNDLMHLNRYVELLHRTPEKYDVGLSDVVTSVEEYKHISWSPSVEEADGLQTEFKSEAGISQSGEMFIVVLNGVVVTPEDGEVISSEFGPYTIGFKFKVAPSVGDIVEFHTTRIAGKSARPFEEALNANEKYLDENESSMNAFVSDMATIKAEKESDKAQVNQEITELEADIEDARASREETYQTMLEADSIKEVSDHSEKVRSLDEKINDDFRSDLISSNFELLMINDDLKSITNDEAESSAKHQKITQEANAANNVFTEKRDMFESISDELKGGGAA